jgi:hypothetical protein
MSHRIPTDWKVPATEKHIFIGKYRQFAITFHPDGFIECEMAGPNAPGEMSQLLDWMGVTIDAVRTVHDPNFAP